MSLSPPFFSLYFPFLFQIWIKGLGRSEQGSTDHIKVKVKNDSYGLGANASCEVGKRLKPSFTFESNEGF